MNTSLGKSQVDDLFGITQIIKLENQAKSDDNCCQSMSKNENFESNVLFKFENKQCYQDFVF